AIARGPCVFGCLNRSAVEPVALGLDGQASAHDVAFGAQIFVPCGSRIAAGIEAERVLGAHVEMLIFEAEEYIDQRAFVDHVVEAAAGIPAVVARRAVKPGLVAETVTRRASRGLEIGRSIATRRKDHEAVPGVAQSRAHREQVGDLVLEEGVGGVGNTPARGPTLLEAPAQCGFGAENPGTPLPLRAGVEAEDAIAGAGREVILTSRSGAEAQRI